MARMAAQRPGPKVNIPAKVQGLLRILGDMSTRTRLCGVCWQDEGLCDT